MKTGLRPIRFLPALLALLALVLALPPRSAEARYLANIQDHACWLEETNCALLESFTCDVLHGRHGPLHGFDRLVYDSICAAIDATGCLHEAIEKRRPTRVVHAHALEARCALDRVKTLACNCYLSENTRALLFRSDQILAVIETRLAGHSLHYRR